MKKEIGDYTHSFHPCSRCARDAALAACVTPSDCRRSSASILRLVELSITRTLSGLPAPTHFFLLLCHSCYTVASSFYDDVLETFSTLPALSTGALELILKNNGHVNPAATAIHLDTVSCCQDDVPFFPACKLNIKPVPVDTCTCTMYPHSIEGLIQYCVISSALAMEIPRSCNKPSKSERRPNGWMYSF